ncbi:vWA domain-containing protein [Roseobacter sp. AzwK-3b]|uniref:vWA domain-containing protein n=1 Tax=Roseobacter sp. AzwK-3b TaxID=351016 RepID=UPI001E4E435B|nr:vWA domain-containing protein [Roseobacter sp. AzwK-3b]
MTHPSNLLPRIASCAMGALALTLALTSPAGAVTGCARDAMLVLDGSASMSEIGFDPTAPTRIDEARAALAQAMPRIAVVRRVGLLTYGPGGTDACSGIDLRFGPIDDAAGPIIAAVDALRPGGLTPLAASVQAAAEALNYRTTPGIVVLVTDGNETCGGRPCALGTALADQAEGLTVHVIGFRVQYDPFAWDNPEAQTYDGGAVVAKCLSDRTGGLYVDTQTVEELTEALEAVLGCTVVGRAPENRKREG